MTDLSKLPSEDEIYWTIKAMKKFGGGFVKALAEAMSQADRNNIERIRTAWPEYMDQYGKMGQRLKANDGRTD